MIDLKLDKKEGKKETMEAMEMKAPLYPWGTSLSFNEETLKKLGIESLPEVGRKYTIAAEVEVTGVSERKTQDETSKCLDLQITKMDLNKFYVPKD